MIYQSKIQFDFIEHSETILPLFNPSTTRKTFHELIQGVLLEPNLSDSLKDQYAFLLIRIIYSKLNAKRNFARFHAAIDGCRSNAYRPSSSE